MGRGTTLGVYLKAIRSSGSLLLLLLLYFHGGIITGASAAAAFSSNNATTTEQKCDKVVMVETPELLSYLGNVTFIVPIPFHGRWLTVIKFTSPFTFIGGWGVEVQSFGRKGYALFQANDEENLIAGDELVFQFRVLYGRNAKVPKVLSIRFQNVPICGQPVLEEAEPEITGQHAKYSSPESDVEDSNSNDEEERYVDEDEIQQHINSNNVRLVDSS